MIKNNQKWIASFFIGLIFVNSLGSAMAAESWHISAGETLEYNLLKLENDVTVVEGTFTLSIDSISATFLIILAFLNLFLNHSS